MPTSGSAGAVISTGTSGRGWLPWPTRAAEELRDTVLERSWDEDAQTLSDRLSAGDGLLHRYLHEDSPDGIPGEEARSCSAASGWSRTWPSRVSWIRPRSSVPRCAPGRAPLGYCPSRSTPSSGEFFGNFPQAFSHIGVIAAGVTLARTLVGVAGGRYRADERPGVIDRLVGGTGDLTGRYLLPGLAVLRARGYLSEGFELVGASREDWDDDQFRNWAAGWLQREARSVDGGATTTLLRWSRYERLDLADPASVAACLAGEGPVAVYLALPPAVFPTAVSALHRVGLPADSQVVFEKPFGEDLDSARALNRLIARLVDERHVFRVDHFLAMTTVQNVLGTRLANRVLDPDLE